MTNYKNKFLRFSALLAAFLTANVVCAANPQNSRSAVAGNVAPARTMGREVKRSENISKDSSGATNVTARSAARSVSNVSRSGVRSGANVARSGANVVSGPVVRANTTVARSGTMPGAVARSAVRSGTTPARSGADVAYTGVARAARATAVFDDVSKIGGGYAQCRDSYATCMDQFCAKANDTYRRCYCSARYSDIRTREAALDEVKVLLQQFEDNNLNAVDKSAAEVNAMYTATVGEMAIKNDTSGAQSILNQIGDLLSGKTRPGSTSVSVTGAATTTSVSDPFANDGDIWGGSSSLFDIQPTQEASITDLEGAELFKSAHEQCAQLSADVCSSDAVSSMAKSAYSIMITQDCNLYEKNIDTKREAVETTVRQAEKYLREARLEEYRAHNSADVNECLDKVRTAILADTACGVGYKRCLDYSGAYVNSSTGDALPTPRLFQLTDLITLDGGADVLAQNRDFDTFLDSKRMYAESALDTCRDISDIVWGEFKRAALIEIAQAQDELLESVKASCVDTIRECYDTQTGSLKKLSGNSATATGALSAYTATAMCQDRVTQCAALYGNGDKCRFDGNGKLTSSADTCGLTALLEFVDTVDAFRVADGCASALETHARDLCTPTSGETGEYPWACRNMTVTKLTDELTTYAEKYCVDPSNKSGELSVETERSLERVIADVRGQVAYQLETKCKASNGYWIGAELDGTTMETLESIKSAPKLDSFYLSVYGGNYRDSDTDSSDTDSSGADKYYGTCYENSTRVACLEFNIDMETPLTTYNASTDECEFTDEWYKRQCLKLDTQAYYDKGNCYIPEGEQ